MSHFFQHTLSPPTHNKSKHFKVRSEVRRGREMLQVWWFCLCGRESNRSWEGKELRLLFSTRYVDFKVSKVCYVGSSREPTAGQSCRKIAFLCIGNSQIHQLNWTKSTWNAGWWVLTLDFRGEVSISSRARDLKQTTGALCPQKREQSCSVRLTTEAECFSRKGMFSENPM